MAFFVNEFLGRQRTAWLNSIVKAQCYANGSWIDGKFNRKEVVNENIIIDVTFPKLDETSANITALRLIDKTGAQCAYQEENMSKKKGQGTFIRITIPVKEE